MIAVPETIRSLDTNLRNKFTKSIRKDLSYGIVDLMHDSNSKLGSVKFPEMNRNVMTSLNKEGKKIDFHSGISSPASFVRRNAKSTGGALINNSLEAIAMSGSGSVRAPLDMEGAKEQRQRANKVFNEEMVEKVKEYQQKRLHDLEETKKKIIAK